MDFEKYLTEEEEYYELDEDEMDEINEELMSLTLSGSLVLAEIPFKDIFEILDNYNIVVIEETEEIDTDEEGTEIYSYELAPKESFIAIDETYLPFDNIVLIIEVSDDPGGKNVHSYVTTMDD